MPRYSKHRSDYVVSAFRTATRNAIKIFGQAQEDTLGREAKLSTGCRGTRSIEAVMSLERSA
ncbi:MAG: hypothetical protein AB8H47_28465 [Bacteroidia bacterium]